MPIRYVSAVILAVAVLGLAFVAADEVTSDNSHQQIENEITTLESTAASLFEDEELPPRGLDGAQRHVTVELPGGSLLSEPVEYLEFRQLEGNLSRVEYQFEGGPAHHQIIDLPIVIDDGDSLRLTGTGATYDLLLTLERGEDDEPVVNVRISGAD